MVLKLVLLLVAFCSCFANASDKVNANEEVDNIVEYLKQDKGFKSLLDSIHFNWENSLLGFEINISGLTKISRHDNAHLHYDDENEEIYIQVTLSAEDVRYRSDYWYGLHPLFLRRGSVEAKLDRVDIAADIRVTLDGKVRVQSLKVSFPVDPKVTRSSHAFYWSLLERQKRKLLSKLIGTFMKRLIRNRWEITARDYVNKVLENYTAKL